VADQESGALPATIILKSEPGAETVWLDFEYLGSQEVTDVFGRRVPAGQPYRFSFERFEKKLEWEVRFFNMPSGSSSDSLTQSEIITKTITTATVPELYFAWWGSPAEGVQADSFATLSTTTFDIAPGRYALELTSDDGARMYLDDSRLIDHWDVHEPAVDEIEVELGGRHSIRIEHFEAGGFGTLGFRMRRLR